MKKNVLLVFIMVCCGIFLVSCGSLQNGVIVDKHYLPSRTLYVSGVYNQIEPRYQIVVEGKTTRKKGRREKYYISKQKYDTLMVGDEYFRNK